MRESTGMGPGENRKVAVSPGDAQWMVLISALFIWLGGFWFIIVPNLQMAREWPYWRREHAAVSALAGMWWIVILVTVQLPMLLIALSGMSMLAPGGTDAQRATGLILMVTAGVLFMTLLILFLCFAIQVISGPSRLRSGKRVFFLVPARLERWYLRIVGAPKWPGAPSSFA